MLTSRGRKVAVLVAISLGALFASSLALAANDPPKEAEGVAESPDRPPQARPFPYKAGLRLQRVMRVTREIYVGDRTVSVRTDRGELVAVGDNSLSIKYADGTTADVEMQGEVKVCVSGNPGAQLGDLEAGRPVGIHRSTNLPTGDLTVVVQVREPGHAKQCRKEIMGYLRGKLGAERGNR